ncbi:MAG: phosphoglycerate dehydrogenase [Candidatus Thiodiazotropha sp. (ex Lucina aurantia)]|uniref:D-3-phosphoglycerate dehydrogenase n=2 Tax=Candidatus Thiodiazotropha TaxID=1913444 RepID=A0A7Z0VK80_9GAMM|nr:phosphoglycerate dehydrogenase [Candidatus Thiodiazotropha endolucinida]MBT3012047.1 phosphoglycerate dehydrogenase [Candidatus Thiodiazotropha sp. (ex Lucina pensylvanica)]MBT3015849.1 phosphoglycerate dehydrogenase [Candidatus Thiodiazotropha taylori]MBT3038506.1 phosphoglycerate dehydrogenase [Candidatus Thiodiazotropha sp. (ex Codakia orbicularis)]MBV2104971.1 phosphoglycerate dehydrogenase [Candidatus Thiodiazotropha sp. (ex Lucina aurantia)]MBT3024825.1 phosphoglycerate dehydrogenase 
MYKILTLNNISVAGLDRLPRDTYEVASEITHPDAILLRSHKMHGMEIPETVKAIGRAGAGVNNIPVAEMTGLGIPVFNAPGANANAVKELVLAGALLAARNLGPAWRFTTGLSGDDGVISKQVESGKKNFVGFELPGRTMGVIGLGAIGVKVANACRALGMNVIGYDPTITVQSAWKLASEVEQALSVDDLLSKSDFVTFHVPLTDATANMINAERLRLMKPGSVLLNFARNGIVDDEATVAALDSGQLYAYVCDFPSNLLKDHPRVITLPHLGASTKEAEDNCAIMVAEEVRDYLENGNITNSVNFPSINLPRNGGFRIAVVNSNVPNMVGQISTDLANEGLNILDMLNKSRDDIAVTLLDVDKQPNAELLQTLASIDGVLSVRSLSGEE